MGIQRKNGRDDLGEQKKNNWNIKRGSLNKNSPLKNHFGKPGAGYYQCDAKSQPHFVKFKQFKGVTGKKKRD